MTEKDELQLKDVSSKTISPKLNIKYIKGCLLAYFPGKVVCLSPLIHAAPCSFCLLSPCLPLQLKKCQRLRAEGFLAHDDNDGPRHRRVDPPSLSWHSNERIYPLLYPLDGFTFSFNVMNLHQSLLTHHPDDDDSSQLHSSNA